MERRKLRRTVSAMMKENDQLGQKGAWVWVEQTEKYDKKDVSYYRLARLEGKRKVVFDGEDRVRFVSNKVIMIPLENEQSLQANVPDLIQAQELTEPLVVHYLKVRLHHDFIYTGAGDLLLSMNPLKNVQCHNEEILQAYKRKDYDSLEPHIFKIARKAQRDSVNVDKIQNIVLQGESGSGKTECMKQVVKFLVEDNDDNYLMSQHTTSLEIILESFGNARTTRNANSSRFGRVLEVQLNSRRPCSFKHIMFGLEKERVYNSLANEGSFHILRKLVLTASDELKRQILISDLQIEDFSAISEEGFTEQKDDVALDSIIHALNDCGFNSEIHQQLFTVLGIVLHLGSAAKNNLAEDSVNRASQLLQCSIDSLSKFAPSVKSAESKPFIGDLAAFLYDSLFRWIVEETNKIYVKEEKENEFGVIRIIDMFGFERPSANSLHTLYANFVEETLQCIFAYREIRDKEALYRLEGLEIEDQNPLWEDSERTLDVLLHEKTGLLEILHQITASGKGDPKFLEKMNETHIKTDKYYPLRKTGYFVIKHYGGEVEYHIEDFVRKNSNAINEFCRNFLLNECSYNFLTQICPESFSSLCTTYKSDVERIQDMLDSSDNHHVRCLLPNRDRDPDSFDPCYVSNQLQTSGILSSIQIERYALPRKIKFDTFAARYAVIMPKKEFSNSRSAVSNMFEELKLNEVQIGNTMAFYSNEIHDYLERTRFEALQNPAKVLVKYLQGHMVRRKMKYYRTEIKPRLDLAIEHNNVDEIQNCINQFEDRVAFSNSHIEKGRQRVIFIHKLEEDLDHVVDLDLEENEEVCIEILSRAEAISYVSPTSDKLKSAYQKLLDTRNAIEKLDISVQCIDIETMISTIEVVRSLNVHDDHPSMKAALECLESLKEEIYLIQMAKELIDIGMYEEMKSDLKVEELQSCLSEMEQVRMQSSEGMLVLEKVKFISELREALRKALGSIDEHLWDSVHGILRREQVLMKDFTDETEFRNIEKELDYVETSKGIETKLNKAMRNMILEDLRSGLQHAQEIGLKSDISIVLREAKKFIETWERLIQDLSHAMCTGGYSLTNDEVHTADLDTAVKNAKGFGMTSDHENGLISDAETLLLLRHMISPAIYVIDEETWIPIESFIKDIEKPLSDYPEVLHCKDLCIFAQKAREIEGQLRNAMENLSIDDINCILKEAREIGFDSKYSEIILSAPTLRDKIIELELHLKKCVSSGGYYGELPVDLEIKDLEASIEEAESLGMTRRGDRFLIVDRAANILQLRLLLSEGLGCVREDIWNKIDEIIEKWIDDKAFEKDSEFMFARRRSEFARICREIENRVSVALSVLSLSDLISTLNEADEAGFFGILSPVIQEGISTRDSMMELFTRLDDAIALECYFGGSDSKHLGTSLLESVLQDIASFGLSPFMYESIRIGNWKLELRALLVEAMDTIDRETWLEIEDYITRIPPEIREDDKEIVVTKERIDFAKHARSLEEAIKKATDEQDKDRLSELLQEAEMIGFTGKYSKVIEEAQSTGLSLNKFHHHLLEELSRGGFLGDLSSPILVNDLDIVIEEAKVANIRCNLGRDILGCAVVILNLRQLLSEALATIDHPKWKDIADIIDTYSIYEQMKDNDELLAAEKRLNFVLSAQDIRSKLEIAISDVNIVDIEIELQRSAEIGLENDFCPEIDVAIALKVRVNNILENIDDMISFGAFTGSIDDMIEYDQLEDLLVEAENIGMKDYDFAETLITAKNRLELRKLLEAAIGTIESRLWDPVVQFCKEKDDSAFSTSKEFQNAISYLSFIHKAQNLETSISDAINEFDMNSIDIALTKAAEIGFDELLSEMISVGHQFRQTLGKLLDDLSASMSQGAFNGNVNDKIATKELEEAIMNASKFGIGLEHCDLILRKAHNVLQLRNMLKEALNSVQANLWNPIQELIVTEEIMQDNPDFLAAKSYLEFVERGQELEVELNNEMRSFDLVAIEGTILECQSIGLDSSLSEQVAIALQFRDDLKNVLNDLVVSTSSGGFEGDADCVIEIDKLDQAIQAAYDIGLREDDCGGTLKFAVATHKLRQAMKNCLLSLEQKPWALVEEIVASYVADTSICNAEEFIQTNIHLQFVKTSQKIAQNLEEAVHSMNFEMLQENLDEAASIGLTGKFDSIVDVAEDTKEMIISSKERLSFGTESLVEDELRKALEFAESINFCQFEYEETKRIYEQVVDINARCIKYINEVNHEGLKKGLSDALQIGMRPESLELVNSVDILVRRIEEVLYEMDSAVQALDIAGLETAEQFASELGLVSKEITIGIQTKEALIQVVNALKSANMRMILSELNKAIDEAEKQGFGTIDEVNIAKVNRERIIECKAMIEKAITAKTVDLLTMACEFAESIGYELEDDIIECRKVLDGSVGLQDKCLRALECRARLDLEHVLDLAQAVGWDFDAVEIIQEILALLKDISICEQKIEISKKTLDIGLLNEARQFAADIQFDHQVSFSDIEQQIFSTIGFASEGIEKLDISTLEEALLLSNALQATRHTSCLVEQVEDLWNTLLDCYNDLAIGILSLDETKISRALELSSEICLRNDAIEACEVFLAAMRDVIVRAEKAIFEKNLKDLLQLEEDIYELGVELLPIVHDVTHLRQQLQDCESTVSSAIETLNVDAISEALDFADSLEYSTPEINRARELRNTIINISQEVQEALESRNLAKMERVCENATILGIDGGEFLLELKEVVQSIRRGLERLDEGVSSLTTSKIQLGMRILEKLQYQGDEIVEAQKVLDNISQVRSLSKRALESRSVEEIWKVVEFAEEAKVSELQSLNVLMTLYEETLVSQERLKAAIVSRDPAMLKESIELSNSLNVESEELHDVNRLLELIEKSSSMCGKAVDERDFSKLEFVLEIMKNNDLMHIDGYEEASEMYKDMLSYVQLLAAAMKSNQPHRIERRLEEVRKKQYKMSAAIEASRKIREITELLNLASSALQRPNAALMRQVLQRAEILGLSDHELVLAVQSASEDTEYIQYVSKQHIFEASRAKVERKYLGPSFPKRTESRRHVQHRISMDKHVVPKALQSKAYNEEIKEDEVNAVTPQVKKTTRIVVKRKKKVTKRRKKKKIVDS